MNSYNFKIETALNSVEAIEKLEKIIQDQKECCKWPKLIFIDIEMPIKNGFEIFQEIKEIFKRVGNFETKIIASTGHSDEETAKKIEDCGFDFYLVKPIMISAIESIFTEFMINSN